METNLPTSEIETEVLPPTKAAPDKRITIIRDWYIQWYRAKFKNDKGEPLSPAWSGKESKLCKDFICRYMDANNIHMDRVLEVIDWYMQTPEQFVVKVDRRFSFLAQEFSRHYLAAIKDKFVSTFKPNEPAKVAPPKDPLDGMTWTEKRAHYDRMFDEASDADIRNFLERAGPKFLRGLVWAPFLKKLAPDSYRMRVWKICCELWGEQVCRDTLSGKKIKENLTTPNGQSTT